MLYILICAPLFSQNIVSWLQLRGRVTGPGDVSRRKLGVHPSVELVTSVCSSFRPSAAASRLTMSGAGRLCALLFVWILCGVTGGSEAQTPAPPTRTSPPLSDPQKLSDFVLSARIRARKEIT